MRDFREFRDNWRPFSGAMVGMGTGLLLNLFILSTFAPYIIKDFGWSRSQWAMLGFTSILMVICQPVAGRLTDRFGVRRVAALGALSFPLFLAATTLVNGHIYLFVGLYAFETIVCSTSTATVYTRVAAEFFKERRGLALGLLGASPSLVGAGLSVVATHLATTYGWRPAFLMIAAFCAAGAILALWLLPKSAAEAGVRPHAEGVYAKLLRTPTFWTMLIGCFLVILPLALISSSLKLIVQEQHLSDIFAATMISLFALSSLGGRLVAGLALDYVEPHLVAVIGFCMPIVSLLLFASSYDTQPVVTVAILLLGLSFGGEVDIIPFLVTRHFDISIFSTVMGLMSAAMGAALAVGALIISASLALTNSFNLFGYVSAGLCVIGCLLFALLGLGQRATATRALKQA